MYVHLLHESNIDYDMCVCTKTKLLHKRALHLDEDDTLDMHTIREKRRAGTARECVTSAYVCDMTHSYMWVA